MKILNTQLGISFIIFQCLIFPIFGSPINTEPKSSSDEIETTTEQHEIILSVVSSDEVTSDSSVDDVKPTLAANAEVKDSLEYLIVALKEEKMNMTDSTEDIDLKLTLLPSEEVKDPVRDVVVVLRQEQENKSDSATEDLKLTLLPAEEVKDPVKEVVVVFRQEEGEEEEDETDEEDSEETTASSTSSSTVRPKVSSQRPVPEEEELPPPKIPEKPVSANSPVPNVESSSAATVAEVPNLDNFEGLSPAVPSSPNPSELEDVQEESGLVEEPSQPPPAPSIQTVQTGFVPVQEPGEFTKRPKPTEPPVASARPEPIFEPEVPGVPVEENPGSVLPVKEAPLPVVPVQVETSTENDKIAVLPPATGKYKITKPKVPEAAAVLFPKQPPADPDSPLTISDEWNITNSVFTLSPQGRASCECGKTPFKVDNADRSGINEYPWTVALVRTGIFGGAGRPFCAGVLINNAYVLSSASCFVSFNADTVQVWLTAHNNFQSIDNAIHSDRILKRDVREIFMHPNYDRTTHDNDIALAKLSHPVDISTSSYYVPACLPAGMSTYDGMTARVIGWGSSANRFATNRMCKEDIQVISNPVCNRDTAHRNRVTGNQMCAGSLAKQQPAESCAAEAGGPLMLPNNGRYTLIGLVSHGYINRQAFTPVVYTRVGTYADWILHNTDDAEWCSL